MRVGEMSADLTPTRSRNVAYLPGVDVLRGLAAVFIVVYHGMQQIRVRMPGQVIFPTGLDPVRSVVIEGHSAVALFMVLSGFILTFGAWGRSVNPAGFLRNRALRVLPMYVLVLAIGMVAHRESLSIVKVIPYVTFVATPPLPFVELGAWSAVMWTVSVEVAFYLMFPFLLAAAHRFGSWSLAVLIAVVASIRVGVAFIDPIAARDLSYWTIVGRFDQFAIGMLGAVLVRRHGSAISRRVWWTVTAVGLGGVVVALDAFNAHGSFFGAPRWRAVWPLVEGAVWAAIVVGTIAATMGASGPIVRWAGRPGIVSYSAYLWHYPIVLWVARRRWTPLGRAWPDAAILTFGVVLPVTFALSTLTYLAVERPFMRRRVAYLGPQRD